MRGVSFDTIRYPFLEMPFNEATSVEGCKWIRTKLEYGQDDQQDADERMKDNEDDSKRVGTSALQSRVYQMQAERQSEITPEVRFL